MKYNILKIIGIIFLILTNVGGNVLVGGADQRYEIIVSAATSLTNAMTEIGKAFEQANPGVNVVFNFASSGSLLQQLIHGAPVDLFASANQKFMDDAEHQELLLPGSRTDFIGNTLVLAVPRDSKCELHRISDLDCSDVTRIALGNPDSVPAGRYAREALQGHNVWEKLQEKYIYANSVRQILDYLRRGEVDVGLVYSTDAIIGGDKVKVVMEVGKHRPIIYPIAVMGASKQPDIAQQFVDFVLSEPGQEILLKFGFRSLPE